MVRRLSYTEYIKWLKESWCHLYLTHPFVASWSFAEAIASGTKIVASDVEPVKEFVASNTKQILLVDHRNPQDICKAVSNHLRNGPIIAANESDEEILTKLGLEAALKGWTNIAAAKPHTRR